MHGQPTSPLLGVATGVGLVGAPDALVRRECIARAAEVRPVSSTPSACQRITCADRGP